MPRNDLPARIVFGAICIGLLVIAGAFRTDPAKTAGSLPLSSPVSGTDST